MQFAMTNPCLQQPPWTPHQVQGSPVFTVPNDATSSSGKSQPGNTALNLGKLKTLNNFMEIWCPSIIFLPGNTSRQQAPSPHGRLQRNLICKIHGFFLSGVSGGRWTVVLFAINAQLNKSIKKQKLGGNSYFPFLLFSVEEADIQRTPSCFLSHKAKRPKWSFCQQADG